MPVRNAHLDDRTQVIELLKQFPAEEITVRWEDAARTFERILEGVELGTILVAEEEDRLLGVITLSYPTAIRCAGLYACIEEFIVAEQGRGRGVGGKLLEAALAEARRRGCHELQVNRPSPSGYPLYLRNGFEDLGRHLKIDL
jgi:GNAT superfamily N-acetyltransferase